MTQSVLKLLLVTQTGKDLTFYPPCKLTNWPDVAPWKLVEAGLWVKKKKKRQLITHRNDSCQSISILMLFPQAPVFEVWYEEEQVMHSGLGHRTVTLRLRNSGLLWWAVGLLDLCPVDCHCHYYREQ